VKNFIIILSLVLNITNCFSKADEIIYLCTGANSPYFPHLMNLIGSIHKNNFESLKEIMVFDLGLTSQEREHLLRIKKVVIRDIVKTHPDTLTLFEIPARKVLGWYAWKPCALHQALQEYPYVLWIDAGTTVLRPIDDLMRHIIENGYFLITSGDEKENEKFSHSVGWTATEFVRKKFNVDAPENQWILDQECIMGGLNGLSREAYNYYLKDWYEASYDLRNFADDGTTPGNGWHSRHDQTYLSFLTYTKGLNFSKQDYTQQKPTMLKVNNQDVPFYITWNYHFVSHKTHIYNSRNHLSKIREYINYIQYR
jgi:hypothetical protein